jgi:hypothetical protein
LHLDVLLPRHDFRFFRPETTKATRLGRPHRLVMRSSLSRAPPVEGFLWAESAVRPLRASSREGRGGDNDPASSVECDHVVVYASFLEIEAGEYTEYCSMQAYIAADLFWPGRQAERHALLTTWPWTSVSEFRRHCARCTSVLSRRLSKRGLPPVPGPRPRSPKR